MASENKIIKNIFSRFKKPKKEVDLQCEELQKEISIKNAQRKPACYDVMITDVSNKSRLKFVIISGCQYQMVARSIEVLTGGRCKEFFIGSQLNDFAINGWLQYKDDFDECDYIYTQKISIYNFLRGKEEYKCKVKFFPVISCPAFHPDITYMRYENQPIVSPMGDYHSAIITASFFSDFTESKAVGLFSLNTYESLGFLDKKENALNSFHKDFDKWSIDTRKIVQGEKFSVPWMRTLNHPKKEMVFEVVLQALLRDKIPVINISTNTVEWFHDNLSDSVDWPVYPELLSNNSETSDNNLVFKLPYKTHGENIFLSLEEFVHYSYLSLEGKDSEKIIMNQLPFKEILKKVSSL